jgi:hypothetical protein
LGVDGVGGCVAGLGAAMREEVDWCLRDRHCVGGGVWRLELAWGGVVQVSLSGWWLDPMRLVLIMHSETEGFEVEHGTGWVAQ